MQVKLPKSQTKTINELLSLNFADYPVDRSLSFAKTNGRAALGLRRLLTVHGSFAPR